MLFNISSFDIFDTQNSKIRLFYMINIYMHPPPSPLARYLLIKIFVRIYPIFYIYLLVYGFHIFFICNAFYEQPYMQLLQFSMFFLCPRKTPVKSTIFSKDFGYIDVFGTFWPFSFLVPPPFFFSPNLFPHNNSPVNL